MPGKLVVTMKVENLTPAPISGYRWYVYFNTPNRTDVESQLVGMDTVAPGGSSAAPAFIRGFRETIDTPAAGVGSFTIEGNLPGSSYNADGTITLVLDKAQFGLTTGMTVTAIAGSIRQTSNPTNGAGLTVDSAAAIEGYTLVGNLPCPTVTPGPQAVLVASVLSGPAPLVVDFDASGSTTPAAGGITSYTFDFGDGTAPVTQATPTVQHTYTKTGSYTATLTVTDSTNTVSSNAAVQTIKVTGVGNTRLAGSLPALSVLLLGLFALGRRRR
jgi:PKD repeat protein